MVREDIDSFEILAGFVIVVVTICVLWFVISRLYTKNMVSVFPFAMISILCITFTGLFSFVVPDYRIIKPLKIVRTFTTDHNIIFEFENKSIRHYRDIKKYSNVKCYIHQHYNFYDSKCGYNIVVEPISDKK
jgi:energy-coupling factor transporter transmembrane protein EcfT